MDSDSSVFLVALSTLCHKLKQYYAKELIAIPHHLLKPLSVRFFGHVIVQFVLNIIVGGVHTQGPEATKQLPENFLSKFKLQFFESFLHSVKNRILGKSFLDKLSGDVNKLAATQILVNIDTQSGQVADRF